MAKKEESKRGRLLTIVLVALFFFHIWALKSALSSSFLGATKLHYARPAWYQIYYIISSLISFGILWGVWNLKKVAVYIAIAILFIGIPVAFYSYYTFTIKPLPLPVQILILGMYYFLFYFPIYKRWKYFT